MYIICLKPEIFSYFFDISRQMYLQTLNIDLRPLSTLNWRWNKNPQSPECVIVIKQANYAHRTTQLPVL